MLANGQAPVQAGEVIAQRYRIERVIGEGGMGVVALATHLKTGQRVAVKVMLPELMSRADAVHRFLREARAALQLQSAHVARVYDVGQAPSGAPFIVMEYLEGSELGDMLRQHGPVPVPTAVDLLLQTCEAIAEAHSLGIIHRDLKPSNLFVIRQLDGSLMVKVLDFGVSKALGEDIQLTKTSALIGSPMYMSPEQFRSAKSVDGRADQWSLGVLLYELVTGRLPFIAQSLPELCFKIWNEAAPPLPAAAWPPGFEAVVRRCLEKDPAARFSDVVELARALAPFGTPAAWTRMERIMQLRASVPPRQPSGAQEAASPATTWKLPAPGQGAAPAGSRSRSRSRSWLVVLIVAALGVAGGVVAALLAR